MKKISQLLLPTIVLLSFLTTGYGGIPAPYKDLILYLSPNKLLFHSGDSSALQFIIRHELFEQVIPSSKTKFYLSKNDTLDANDPLIGQSILPSFGYHGTDTFNVSLSIPALVDSGSYYIIGFADADSSFSERDEYNNISTLRILIGDPYADLTGGFYHPWKQSTVNTYVLLSLYENLNGSGPVNSHTNRIYISKDSILDPQDAVLTENRTPIYQNPGINYSGAEFYIWRHILPGKYYLLYVNDALNEVEEYNEYNNVASVPFEVLPSDIDLRSHLVSAYPQEIATGSPLSLSYTIKNHGTTAASNFNIGYFLSNDSIFNASDDTLLNSVHVYNPYQDSLFEYNHFVNIPNFTSLGTHYVFVVADYDNNIIESNEGNNSSRYIRINVVEGNTNITFRKAIISDTLAIGNIYGSYISVGNTGNTYVYGQYVNFYLSKDTVLDLQDLRIYQSSLYPLAPGAYDSLSTYVSLFPNQNITPGNYYVLFVADDYNLYQESNENDNILVKPVKVVLPDVDYRTRIQKILPASVVQGNKITVENLSLNAGSSRTSSPVNLQYVLTASRVIDSTSTIYYLGESEYIPVLNGGQSYSTTTTLTVPEYISPGRYYVHSIIDISNYQSELNENNNTAVSAITVRKAQYDLSVSALRVDARSGFPGDSVGVSFRIRNAGNTYVDSIWYSVAFSEDRILSYEDVVYRGYTELNANENIQVYSSVNVPFNAGFKRYYIFVKVEKYGSNAETNLRNNSSYVPFDVIYADSSFAFRNGVSEENNVAEEVLTASPNPVNEVLNVSWAGENVTGSITIENLQGAEMWKKENVVLLHDLTIDTALLPSGVYLLKVNTPSGQKVKKIVKQ